jgi:hypothetical protein
MLPNCMKQPLHCFRIEIKLSLLFYEMCRRVNWQIVTGVFEEPSSSLLKMEASLSFETVSMCLTTRCHGAEDRDHHVLPYIALYSVESQPTISDQRVLTSVCVI